MNKEKRISLGAYPLISLAEAREERDKAKKLLLKDIDPSAARKENKANIKKEIENSFKAVSLEWFDNNLERWSEGYAKKIKRILEMHLYPIFGDTPITKITPHDLLEALRKVEAKGKYDMASKTKQIAGIVLRYGIQTGRCEWNPADNLQGALKAHKTEHFAAFDIKELPAFLKALNNNTARLYERTRQAIEILEAQRE